MTRNLMKNRRDAGKSAKRGFKGKAAALLASAAIGLSACGETIHNHYYETDGGAPTIVVEPPEVNVEPPDVTVNMPTEQTEISGLCGDEPTVSVEYEVTLNQGEYVPLVNGFRLHLIDFEPDTQTAFFHLTDDMNNVLWHVDMVEGVEGAIDFGEGDVAIVACSVRAGYTFGEKSVTLRADTNIARPPPECGVEEGETGLRIVPDDGMVQDIRQTIRFDSCEERGPITILSERTTLEPALEAGEDGEGLAENRRLTLNVCSGTYTLVGVHPDGLDFGKEAAGGIIMEGGESLPLPSGFSIELMMVEEHGGVDNAIINLVNGSGETDTRIRLEAGDTTWISSEGETYTIHVYQVGAGGTPGTGWANIALLSQFVELREGELTDLTCSSAGGDVDGTYSFTMEWGPGNTVRGWELTRE